VIAADETGAQALIADVATVMDGPIRVELDTRHPGLLEWAEARGLVPGAVAPCMVYGDRSMPGDASRRYARCCGRSREYSVSHGHSAE
jgi:hypothetical protein